VARDDEAALVDQNRDHKSERFNTARYLADLLPRVCPRVARIRLERADGDPLHRKHESLLMTAGLSTRFDPASVHQLSKM
jgi:hypothetical protein